MGRREKTMAYFPFFVDIEDQDCLIVGGGIVALRKVEVLAGYGPRITVVSPVIESELEAAVAASEGRISLKRREFSLKDLEERDFVIAATDDEVLNRKISEECRKRRIPVNVVDVQKECSFIFPSIVREGDIVVGISSGGKSPTVTQYLKKQVRENIPEGYGRLVDQLGAYRDYVKARVPEVKDRTVIFKRMVDVGRDHGCCLTDELVDQLIEAVLAEKRA